MAELELNPFRYLTNRPVVAHDGGATERGAYDAGHPQGQAVDPLGLPAGT
jgi:acyl-CoA synthetase (NDP forming)